MILACVLVSAEMASAELGVPFLSGADLAEVLYLGALKGLVHIFGLDHSVEEKGYIAYLHDKMRSVGFDRPARGFSSSSSQMSKSIFLDGMT